MRDIFFFHKGFLLAGGIELLREVDLGPKVDPKHRFKYIVKLKDTGKHEHVITAELLSDLITIFDRRLLPTVVEVLEELDNRP